MESKAKTNPQTSKWFRPIGLIEILIHDRTSAWCFSEVLKHLLSIGIERSRPSVSVSQTWNHLTTKPSWKKDNHRREGGRGAGRGAGGGGGGIPQTHKSININNDNTFFFFLFLLPQQSKLFVKISFHRFSSYVNILRAPFSFTQCNIQDLWLQFQVASWSISLRPQITS